MSFGWKLSMCFPNKRFVRLGHLVITLSNKIKVRLGRDFHRFKLTKEKRKITIHILICEKVRPSEFEAKLAKMALIVMS